MARRPAHARPVRHRAFAHERLGRRDPGHARDAGALQPPDPRQAAQAADRLAQPRLATYLLLEKSRVRPAPERRVVAVSGLIMDQLHRSYGPAWPWTSSRPASSCPRPPTPPSARPCATGWAGTPTPSVACWWRATRCAGVAGAAGRLGAAARALPAAGGRGRRSHARTRARRRRHRAPGRPDRTHPEVAQYFSAADIYAHPTLNDSYGMAPLEAMSHGLPVVVSSPAYCGFAQYLSAGGRADPAGPAQRRAAGAGAGAAVRNPNCAPRWPSAAWPSRASRAGKRWRRVMKASTRRCCANGSRRRPDRENRKRGVHRPVFFASLPGAIAPRQGDGRKPDC